MGIFSSHSSGKPHHWILPLNDLSNIPASTYPFFSLMGRNVTDDDHIAELRITIVETSLLPAVGNRCDGLWEGMHSHAARS